MSLIFKGGGFIHVPRTGGRFVERYIEKTINKKTVLYFPKHQVRDIHGKVFVCVRHPVKYIQSYYQLMVTKRWSWSKDKRPESDLNHLKGNTIDDFVDNIVSSKGCLLEYFESFHVGDVVVGRTESLEKDLHDYLSGIGYKASDNTRNQLNCWKSPMKDIYIMSEDSKKRLIKSESELIRKYYDSYDIQP